MILADSSIWIRGLADIEPFASEMRWLLRGERIIGHHLVYGELLIGDKAGRRAALAAYSLMGQCPVVDHNEMVEFVRHHRLHGRGVGWIDAHILAAAVAAKHQLDADRRLHVLAVEFGVAFQGARVQ